MPACSDDGLCEIAKTRFCELDRRVEMRIKALEDSVDRRFEANQAAIDKAEQTLSIRLEGMNEFREQITTERLEYVKHREGILMTVIISIVVVILGLVMNHLVAK